MTDAPRTFALPLSFLATGRYTARTWQAGVAPTDLVTATRNVAPSDTLSLVLSPSGGAAVILEPNP